MFHSFVFKYLLQNHCGETLAPFYNCTLFKYFIALSWRVSASSVPAMTKAAPLKAIQHDTPPADRGRFYYLKQTLRWDLQPAHDCFSAQEVRQRHYGLDPFGKHPGALRLLPSPERTQKLIWRFFSFFQRILEADHWLFNTKWNQHCKPTEHPGYVIESVTCWDDSKTIFADEPLRDVIISQIENQFPHTAGVLTVDSNKWEWD